MLTPWSTVTQTRKGDIKYKMLWKKTNHWAERVNVNSHGQKMSHECLIERQAKRKLSHKTRKQMWAHFYCLCFLTHVTLNKKRDKQKNFKGYCSNLVTTTTHFFFLENLPENDINCNTKTLVYILPDITLFQHILYSCQSCTVFQQVCTLLLNPLTHTFTYLDILML